MNSLLRDKGEAITPVVSAPVLRSEVDSTLKYFLIFLVLGFSSAIGFSYFFSQFNDAVASTALLKAAGVGSLFIIIVMFQSFFIQSFYFNLILVLIHTAGLLGFFYDWFSPWFILAGLGFIFFWVLAYSKGKHELNMNLKIDFWRYSMFTLVKIISGMSIFIALMYAGAYTQSGAISYQAYQFTISRIPGIEVVAPNFNPSTNLDRFFKNNAQNILESPEYASLSQEEKALAAEQLAAQLQAETLRATGVKAGTNDTILDYTYRLALQGTGYLQTHGLGSLVVMAIIAFVFFAIKGIMFFIQWPLLVISTLIYFGLLSVGIITLESEMRQKEVAVIH